MSKRTALLLSLILGLAVFLIVRSVTRTTPNEKSGSAGGLENPRRQGADETQDSAHEGIPKFRRERPDDSEARRHRDLEKEFNEILPPRFSPDSTSLSDVSLKPGETLVLAGSKTAGGDYNFATFQVEAVEGEAGPSYSVSTKTLTLSREQSEDFGLGSILSPARMRIQKNVILPPGENAWMQSASSFTSMPRVTTAADSATSLTLDTEDRLHIIDLIASPGDDGQSTRIRIRDQSLKKE